MWDARSETPDGGRVRRVGIERDGRPMPFAEVLAGWRDDDAFRAWFIGLLAAAPYPAYLWETPPLTRASAARAFEFALIDSPALAEVPADRRSFADPFAAAGREADVAVFANLGGDAVLVAPRPRTPDDAWPHLASFARTAPPDRQHAFWRTVAAAVANRLGDSPLWLSTNGLGVAWLHVRLDTRPKYYAFAPYRRSL